jgi:hypothetical protein
LLANNPNVNAEQLRERLEACKKLRPSKYNYNLIAPFAGRLHRRCAAEVGGSADNVRQKS